MKISNFITMVLLMTTVSLIQCSSNTSNTGGPNPEVTPNVPVDTNQNCTLSLTSGSGPTNPCPTTEDDTDSDGFKNDYDNCYNVFNPDQIDTDHDGVGEICDNCPNIANIKQLDADQDGIGNLCDQDSDNDGIANNSDNCPKVSNQDQLNTDGDTCGDACDDAINEASICKDFDHDGFDNKLDNCVATSNPDQYDTDKDGIGNACDLDDDNDGLRDEDDPYPLNPSHLCPGDNDADGICNNYDNCPNMANIGQGDSNNNQIGDVCENENPATNPNAPLDTDGDGIPDDIDNCPQLLSLLQNDADGDGVGDECDDDRDGDGILDMEDNCLWEPNPLQENFDGDYYGNICDHDADNDGLCDNPILCTVIDPVPFYGNPWYYIDPMANDTFVEQYGRPYVFIQGIGIGAIRSITVELDGIVNIPLNDGTYKNCPNSNWLEADPAYDYGICILEMDD